MQSSSEPSTLLVALRLVRDRVVATLNRLSARHDVDNAAAIAEGMGHLKAIDDLIAILD